MATYVEKFAGYIADVPRLWFKRCDGRIFYFDELTAATVSPQINYTEVSAGWSLFPVAYLPGQSTFEMQITSGKFEADLFVMTNATKFNANDSFRMMHTETLDVDGQNQVELAHTPVSGTISIPYPNERGMMEETAQTVAAGKKVTFRVKASGKNLKYQWYYRKDSRSAWKKITSKGTSASYTFKVKASQNGYQYRCLVKNSAGKVYSKAVKLKVKK